MIAELAWLAALVIFLVLPVSWTFDVRGVRLGLSHDHIYGNRPENRGNVYLERWILWLPGVALLRPAERAPGQIRSITKPRLVFASYTLRLHKFHRGDEERALHDHPWWFVTFPLGEYFETFWDGRNERGRWVRPLRFHYRPDKFRHRVELGSPKPAYTLVLTGPKTNRWGFWPKSDIYVYWREWFARTGQTPASGTVGDDV